MRNFIRKSCYIPIIFPLLFTVHTEAQDLGLEVEGNAKILGHLDVRPMDDETSLVIGYDAGINTVFDNDLLSTFVGYRAGNANTIGYDLTFIGANAGLLNDEGDQNSFLGVDAGRNNTNGYRNTFIGHSSGYSNTLGRDNTFLGSGAGYRGSEGKQNTYIGTSSGQLMDTGFLTNAIAIGYRAKVNCDSCAVIGASGSGSVNVGIGISEPTADLHLHEKDNTRFKISNDSGGHLDVDFIRDQDGGGLRDWRIRNSDIGIMEIGYGNDIDNNASTILLELSPIRLSASSNGTIELGTENKQWEKVWSTQAHFSQFMQLQPQASPPSCASDSDRGKVYYDDNLDKLRVCTSVTNGVQWVNLH